MDGPLFTNDASSLRGYKSKGGSSAVTGDQRGSRCKAPVLGRDD